MGFETDLQKRQRKDKERAESNAARQARLSGVSELADETPKSSRAKSKTIAAKKTTSTAKRSTSKRSTSKRSTAKRSTAKKTK